VQLMSLNLSSGHNACSDSGKSFVPPLPNAFKRKQVVGCVATDIRNKNCLGKI
jgi:hypothetical protein